MKRVILYLTTLLLLSASCEKIPKDVKPIDWESYNDVYNVFWNYYTLCSKAKNEDAHKNIMIYGWMYPQWGGGLILGDIPNKVNVHEYPCIDIKFFGIATELQAKLDTCDLTKKCFIKGKLIFNCLNKQMNSKSVPEVIIKNTDDIYFE